MEPAALSDRRHHRSRRNKSEHHRTAQASHAHGSHHVSADKSWPTLLAAPDGDKENLVQGWLDDVHMHTSASANQPEHHSKKRNSKHLPDPKPWAPHGLPVFANLGNSSLLGRPRQEQSRKRKRVSVESGAANALDDDLGHATDLESAPRVCRPRSAAEIGDYGRGKEYQPGSDSGLSSSAPSRAEYNFEKRARHKTRSDRYNIVKNDDTDREKKRSMGQEPRKDSRKSKRKRHHMPSSKDVMDHFSSNSILNDRITMHPSLRPGLFDNGRRSDQQVTDLTFHEMSFLKQPRREPQKPLSRRRKSEKERDEREREEISAFFLHKDLPGRDDARARRQPTVSGLSSVGEQTGDSSMTKLGRQVPRNEPDPRGKGSSRASTYVSWSTSHPSPGLGRVRPNDCVDTRDPVHEGSSTPADVREALAQSGIFDNTGILYGPRPGRKSEADRVYFTDDSARKSSTFLAQGTAQNSEAAPNLAVRIVHYQDRGTSANEEFSCTDPPAGYTKDDLQRHASADAELGGMDVLKHTIQDVSLMPENAVTAMPPPNSNANKPIRDGLPIASASDRITNMNQEDPGCQTGPARPRSPKWAVIEDLEAAAQDLRTEACPQAASSAPWMAQHDYRSYGGLETRPTLAATNVPRPSPHPPNSTHDTGWPSGHVIAPTLNDHRGTEMTLPLFGSTASAPRFPVTTDPTRCCVPHKLVVNGALYQPNQRTMPLSDTIEMTRWGRDMATTQDSQAQQSFQSYITQLEHEVLDYPREYGRHRVSPVTSGVNVGGPMLEDLDGITLDNDYQLQPHVTSYNSPGELEPRNFLYQDTIVPSLEHDEEDRFASSFWRPHRYPT